MFGSLFGMVGKSLIGGAIKSKFGGAGGNLLGSALGSAFGNIGSGIGLGGKEGGFMSHFGTGEGKLSDWKPGENIAAGKGIFGKEGGFGSGKGFLSKVPWEDLAMKATSGYLAKKGVPRDITSSLMQGVDFLKSNRGSRVQPELDSIGLPLVTANEDPAGANEVPQSYGTSTYFNPDWTNNREGFR